MFTDVVLVLQPSLNPETTGKPVSQARAVGTPAGVWGKNFYFIYRIDLVFQFRL